MRSMGRGQSGTEGRGRGNDQRRAPKDGIPVHSLTREQRAYQRRRRRRRQLIQRTVAVTALLLLIGAGGAVAATRYFAKPDERLAADDGTGQAGAAHRDGEGSLADGGSGSGAGNDSLSADGSDYEIRDDSPADGSGNGNGGDTDSGSTGSGNGSDDTGSGSADIENSANADTGSNSGSGTGAVFAGADLTQLNSPNALLMDASTGEVLAEHDGYERIYPASMTKIMTALLAVENTDNLNERITMPYDIYDRLYAEEASMAGFQPGEEAALRELLYGILLPSGAECCITFANRIAGSEEAFVGMMNSRAAELGMKDTHFCNCTGLHDADHYSTAADIAALLWYALGSESFREAFTAHRYSVMPTAQHPEGFTFFSTMFQYMESDAVTGGQILGGKTGYTGEAGQCLASLASVNGREYILVTAGAPGSHETEQLHILDAQNVYNRIGAAG